MDFKGVYPVTLPVNVVSHNAYRGLPDSSNYWGVRREPRELAPYIEVRRQLGQRLPGKVRLGGEARTAHGLPRKPGPSQQGGAGRPDQDPPLHLLHAERVVVTLVIVPVFYALMSRHGERNKKAKQRKEFLFMRIKDEN